MEKYIEDISDEEDFNAEENTEDSDEEKNFNENDEEEENVGTFNNIDPDLDDIQFGISFQDWKRVGFGEKSPVSSRQKKLSKMAKTPKEKSLDKAKGIFFSTYSDVSRGIKKIPFALSK